MNGEEMNSEEMNPVYVDGVFLFATRGAAAFSGFKKGGGFGDLGRRSFFFAAQIAAAAATR